MASSPDPQPAWSFEAHRDRQVRAGLELSPAERLRWLEETLEEMRGYLGRAATSEAPRSTPRSG